MKTDLGIQIKYNVPTDTYTILKTNIKKERIRDFLEDWLMTQVGAGKDTRKRVDRDDYIVSIGLDLSDDTFTISSNTNNEGLTCGIIMSVVGKMKMKGEVEE